MQESRLIKLTHFPASWKMPGETEREPAEAAEVRASCRLPDQGPRFAVKGQGLRAGVKLTHFQGLKMLHPTFPPGGRSPRESLAAPAEVPAPDCRAGGEGGCQGGWYTAQRDS
jgi:hypothetical protein